MIDFHTHSCFSGDSEAPLEAQLKAALDLGLEALCFTDHFDAEYPDPDTNFDLDTAPYLKEVAKLQQRFSKQISLYAGVELGLQPHLGNFYSSYCQNWPFDYVIGSTHLVDNQDPYYPKFWANHSTRSGVEAFFQVTLENMHTHDCFDAYGHLDYINRYIPQGYPTFSHSDYTDLIDSCLRLLIHRGKALEVNTGSFRSGLTVPNPGPEILKRYRELGGELLITGSDAHAPQYVGSHFPEIYALIRDCGFRYVTIFRQRKPFQIPL